MRRSGTSIWLALAVALASHVLLVLLPISRQTSRTGTAQTEPLLELRFTTHTPESAAQKPPPPEPRIEPPSSPVEPAESLAEMDREPTDVMEPVPPPAQATDSQEPVKSRYSHLVPAILAAPFISEDSGRENLFRMPPAHARSLRHGDFFYPERQDMFSMLDKPMPNLPFAYTPGLVTFAYEPGFRGDLQRFRDLLTVQFGWKTNNGTEFKCAWFLIVAGCGWK